MPGDRPVSPISQQAHLRAKDIEHLHSTFNTLLPADTQDNLNPSSAYSVIRHFCFMKSRPAEPLVDGEIMPLTWRDFNNHLRDMRMVLAKRFISRLLTFLRQVTLPYHESKLMSFLNTLRNTPIQHSRDWTRRFSVAHVFMVERLWDIYIAARAALMIAINDKLPGVVPTSELGTLRTCPLRIADYDQGLIPASKTWAAADLGWAFTLNRAADWIQDWIKQYAVSTSYSPPSGMPNRGDNVNCGPDRGRSYGRGRGTSRRGPSRGFTTNVGSDAGPGPNNPPPPDQNQPPPQHPNQPPPQHPNQPYTPPTMPPKANSTSGPHLGLAAIDTVDAFTCAVSIFRTVNVPSTLEGAFVHVVGDVLRWHRDAALANNSVGVDNALKWFMAIPQLLLRRPRHGGSSGSRTIKARFRQWENGRLAELVGAWQRDIAVAHPSQIFIKHRTIRTDMQIVHSALRLFYDGQMSRCMSLLTSNGLGDLAKPELLSQFQAKFPTRESCDDFVSPSLLDYTGTTPDLPEMVDLTEYCRSAKRYAGVGPSGLRNEHIQLLGVKQDDPVLAETISLLNRHQHQVMCGQHPSWWYYLNGAANLLFVFKKPLTREEITGSAVPDGRPVGVGDNLRRLTQKAYGDSNHEDWAEWLGPCQFGFIPNGGAKLYFTLHEIMWLHSAQDVNAGTPALDQLVVVKLDLTNCWNRYKRGKTLHRIASGPTGVRRDLPHMHAYGQHILPSFNAGRRIVGCDSAIGGQQGASTSSREGCASFRNELLESHEYIAGVSENRGGHFAIFDDSYIIAPASLAVECVTRFATAVADAGHELAHNKSSWWCVDPTAASEIAASNIMGNIPRGAVVSDDGDIAYGIEVDGVGLGDEAFQHFHAQKRICKAESTIKTLEEQLLFADPCALIRLLIVCVQPAIVHDCRRVRPTVLNDHAKRLHDALLQSVGRTLALRRPGHDNALDSISLERVALRRKDGGLGLTPIQDTSVAGYLAICLECIPSLINRCSGGSSITSPSHTSLVSFFSAGAFDDQSLDWSHWLSSPSPSAAAFRTAHDFIAAGSEQDDLPTVIRGPIDSIGSHECLMHTQRSIARVLSKRRLMLFELQLSSLPTTDRRLIAFRHASKTGVAWLLDPRRCDPQLLFEIAAIFFGLPSPACAPYVGKRLPNGRPLDPYGDTLFNAHVSGFGWREVHDSVLHVFVEGLRAMGIEAQEEVWGLFRLALPQTAACDEHFQSRVTRRALVPDALVTLETFERVLVELKTIQFNHSRYPHPDRPGDTSGVELRARKIPKEYIDKARAADIKWNGTPDIPGATGPVYNLLMQLQSSLGHPVLPLVAGAFGEINLAFDALIKHAAQIGAERLYRRMRLASAPTAKGVLTQQFRTQIGSTIVRGRGAMLLARLSHVGPTPAQAARRIRNISERSFFAQFDIDQLASYYGVGRRGRRSD